MLFTHARQFPHLAGRGDGEIRGLVRRGMDRCPALRRVLRLRNVAVLSTLGIAVLYALPRSPQVGDAVQPGDALRDIGRLLMICGGAATAIVLLWNLIWVNTVLFRLTQIEAGRESDGADDTEG